MPRNLVSLSERHFREEPADDVASLSRLWVKRGRFIPVIIQSLTWSRLALPFLDVILG